MSDAWWTFNPLPGDADSPARSDQACPPRAQSRQGWWPRSPGKGRQGRSVQGGQLPLPVPSGPGLWAQSSVLAANPARSEQPGHLPRGPSHHAPLGPLLSPYPSCPPPRPFPTPKGSKVARVPSSPPLPLHLPAQLQRQAGKPREEGTPDLPGTPQAAVAPGNGIQTTGQHVSWDGKSCSSKALALLAGGPGCFWIPCALTLPRDPKSSPTEVQRLVSASAGPQGHVAR